MSLSVRKGIVCYEVAHVASLAEVTRRGPESCQDVKVLEYGIEPKPIN